MELVELELSSRLEKLGHRLLLWKFEFRTDSKGTKRYDWNGSMFESMTNQIYTVS